MWLSQHSVYVIHMTDLLCFLKGGEQLNLPD